jgi:hypothetical protein
VTRTATLLAYGALVLSLTLGFFVTTQRPENVVFIAGSAETVSAGVQ